MQEKRSLLLSPICLNGESRLAYAIPTSYEHTLLKKLLFWRKSVCVGHLPEASYFSL